MKGMGNILKQAQRMQRKMLEVQEELENLEIERQAGGGMVKVKVNGKGEVLELKIDPQAVDPDEVEMLEDTILAAIHDAVDEARRISEEKMAEATGGLSGMGFPGM